MVLTLALFAPPHVSAAQASQTQAFVATVNEARAAHGVHPLRSAESLRRSSVAYSYWMLEHQSFRHLGSIRAPRRFTHRGEVLALTGEEYPSPETIVAQWLASPSHRAVLLERRFRYVGVGLASGWLGDEPVTLITGHFGGAVSERGGRRPAD